MRRRKKIIFSLLVFLASIEAALQISHQVSIKFSRSRGESGEKVPVILCAGDSHTFGLKVPEEDSYPSRLQRLLDERGVRAKVINDGIPGQNSSMLRRRMPELLERYKPALVIIWISVNDQWNIKDHLWSDLEDGTLPPGPAAWIRWIGYRVLESLRTARLVSYLWHFGVKNHLPAEKTRDRKGRLYFHTARLNYSQGEPPPATLERSRRNLIRIIDLVREAGAEAVLMNYVALPTVPPPFCNRAIEEAAKARGVLLIDNDALIRPRFWRGPGYYDMEERNRLFLPDPEENHMTAAGYALVAQNLYSVLEQNKIIKKLAECRKE